jgi:hypothetical protein
MAGLITFLVGATLGGAAILAWGIHALARQSRATMVTRLVPFRAGQL